MLPDRVPPSPAAKTNGKPMTISAISTGRAAHVTNSTVASFGLPPHPYVPPSVRQLTVVNQPLLVDRYRGIDLFGRGAVYVLSQTTFHTLRHTHAINPSTSASVCDGQQALGTRPSALKKSPALWRARTRVVDLEMNWLNRKAPWVAGRDSSVLSEIPVVDFDSSHQSGRHDPNDNKRAKDDKHGLLASYKLICKLRRRG
jgi:hypothetical protein